VDQIAYTVIAETKSSADACAFATWLNDGHISDVVKAGAVSGQLVSFDSDSNGIHRFEVRYIFDSIEQFGAYEDGPAHLLRDEGIALFGPESEHPIRFQRTVGQIRSYIAGA
jgi:hypothetical protein